MVRIALPEITTRFSYRDRFSQVLVATVTGQTSPQGAKANLRGYSDTDQAEYCRLTPVDLPKSHEEPARKESGYRQYTEDVVSRLRFVRRAKALGFSLREIADHHLR